VARDWCTLNVMLVAKAGIYGDEVCRVGVGIVHEDAWVRADPRGMLIRLI
jgi:hypothetical protein